MCIRDRTYTEAIDLLQKADEKFNYPVSWGIDLQTEHERYLCEKVFHRPVFVTDVYKRQSHARVVQQIFQRLYDQGDIYKGEYECWYCSPCESFCLERQLVDGKCPDCGRPVERTRESSYFLRLSKYADRLIQYINDHEEFIQPASRKNEMLNNFLLPGLEDLCVARSSVKWGIPVTFDEDCTVYVWIDARSNYISALGYLLSLIHIFP